MTTQASPRTEYIAIPTANLPAPPAQFPDLCEQFQAFLKRQTDFQDWIDSKPGLRQALDLLWKHSPDDGVMTDEHIAGANEAVRQINLVTTAEERHYIIKNTIWEDLEIYSEDEPIDYSSLSDREFDRSLIDDEYDQAEIDFLMADDDIIDCTFDDEF